MATVDSSTFDGVSPRTWALFAGIYMFVCGTVIALLLSDLLALLAEILGLPMEYWMVILASPAFAVGVVVWWTLVERRGSYTYRLGGAFGLLTALLTGLVWTGQFLLVWGIEMAGVPVVTYIIAYVLGIATIAGVLSAIPLMYARRHSKSKVALGKGPTL